VGIRMKDEPAHVRIDLGSLSLVLLLFPATESN
jgi:hypothetical protein